MRYRIALSAFLSKLSKHLAPLVCLFVLSLRRDRSAIDPTWIFALAVVSATVHQLARALSRPPIDAASPKRNPDDR